MLLLGRSSKITSVRAFYKQQRAGFRFALKSYIYRTFGVLRSRMSYDRISSLIFQELSRERVGRNRVGARHFPRPSFKAGTPMSGSPPHPGCMGSRGRETNPANEMGGRMA